MTLFKKSNTEDVPLVVSITGTRLGHRVLVVPGRDRNVLVDLAARVGLTGRTLALVDGPAVETTRTAAERTGAVVDVAPLEVPFPIAGDSFDLVVVDDRTARRPPVDTASLLPEILQALRPAGRLVLLVPTGEGLLARFLGANAPPPDTAAWLAAFTQAGFRAVRLVATQAGVGYLEATRPVN
jgi:SAM-dependent methyltransferase